MEPMTQARFEELKAACSRRDIGIPPIVMELFNEVERLRGVELRVCAQPYDPVLASGYILHAKTKSPAHKDELIAALNHARQTGYIITLPEDEVIAIPIPTDRNRVGAVIADHVVVSDSQ